MSLKKKIGTIIRTVIPWKMYKRIRSISFNIRFRRVKFKRNRLKQIVVMGDSHSRFFSGAKVENEIQIHIDENGSINYDKGEDKRFCAFDLGPALAFNLNRTGTKVRALEKYRWLSKSILRGGDLVFFAFGEIDIRMHVFNYVSDTDSYKDVVDKICLNYESFLSMVEHDGYYPVVWGPIASQKDVWKGYAENPAIGMEIERNKATEFFNITMKDTCYKHGWGFLTIYDELMDENYMTKGEYIYDMCHLGDNAKVLFEPRFEKLCKLLSDNDKIGRYGVLLK